MSLEHTKKIFLTIYPFFLTCIPLLWNFTQYPKLVGDEGIYVSQAWWLVSFGKLGPYTYWYDHFPLGWTMIGAWQKLTGGPFLLGMAEFSGRLFSIILISLGAVLLHQISLKLTKSKLLALLTIIIYATSPLSLTLHRQVLLENMAIIWMLLSFWLLLTKTDQKPIAVIFSSFFLGLAILTKESLLFLIPPHLLGNLLLLKTHSNWKLLISISVITLISTLIFFPLLAFIKGELLATSADSVSLVQTITHQLGRGSSLPFWSSESDFAQKWTVWSFFDPVIMFVGLGSLFLNLILDINQKKLLFIHLSGLFFLMFLTRGGLVLEHYIIPLIPLLSLEITFLAKRLGTQKTASISTILAILAITAFNAFQFIPLLSLNATKTQLDAYHHLTNQAKPEDYIVTDNYFFLNLRFNSNLSDRFPHTHWYTKVDQDPYIQTDLFEHHQNTIDWLLLDDMISTDIRNGVSPILAQAKKSAITNKEFPLNNQDETIANLYQQAPYAIEPITLYQTKSDVPSLISYSPMQRLGRLIWIPITKPELTDIDRDLISRQLISGVVIQKSAIQNSNQLQQLVDSIRVMNPQNLQPIIAISFEGGSDTPIPWLNGMNPGSLKSVTEAVEMATTRGNQLKKIGFNTILGPIIDTRRNNSVYDQANMIPKDPQFAIEIAKTYQELDLIPFVRWFPGSYSGIETETLPQEIISIKSVNPEYISPYTTFFKNNPRPAGIIVGNFSFENRQILPEIIQSLQLNTNTNMPILIAPATNISLSQTIPDLISQNITTIIVPDVQEYYEFTKEYEDQLIPIEETQLKQAITINQSLIERINQ